MLPRVLRKSRDTAPPLCVWGVGEGKVGSCGELFVNIGFSSLERSTCTFNCYRIGHKTSGLEIESHCAHAGAEQAIEEEYVLGRRLQDWLKLQPLYGIPRESPNGMSH